MDPERVREEYVANDAFYEETMNALKQVQQMDRGHNVIWRDVVNANGKTKKKAIAVYTSGGIGSNIRDAETGSYYTKVVGSADEDLFFKVVLATGECNSSNGSNTLFYWSPQQCMKHLHIELGEEIVQRWEEKANARVKAIEMMEKMQKMRPRGLGQQCGQYVLCD